jgi:hypothetical protein
VNRWFLGVGLYGKSKSFIGRYVAGSGTQRGLTPGLVKAYTPDGPDVLDGGDVVEGVVGEGLASGCRVRRVGGWFMSLVVGSSVAKNGQ